MCTSEDWNSTKMTKNYWERLTKVPNDHKRVNWKQLKTTEKVLKTNERKLLQQQQEI